MSAGTPVLKSRNGAELKELQFRIEFLSPKASVWRRVVVPSSICFNDFHKVILCLFGWNGDQRAEFCVPEVEEPPFTLCDRRRRLDIERKSIGDYFKKPRDNIEYTYNLKEGWVHHIVLEGVRELRTNVKYPKCVQGKGVNTLESGFKDETPVNPNGSTLGFKPSSVDFTRMEDFDDCCEEQEIVIN